MPSSSKQPAGKKASNATDGLLLDTESARSAAISDVLNARAAQERQEQQQLNGEGHDYEQPSSSSTKKKKINGTNATAAASLAHDSDDGDAMNRSTDSNANMSHLTEHSTVSRLSTTLGEVFSTAKKILVGENPNAIPEEEDEPASMNILVPSDSFRQATKSAASMEDQNDDDGPQIIIDFLLDDTHEMTLGRRIATALMNKAWYYNPSSINAAAAEASSENEEEEEGEEAHALLQSTTATAASSSPMLLAKSKSFDGHQLDDDNNKRSNDLLLSSPLSNQHSKSSSLHSSTRSHKAQSDWRQAMQQQQQEQMQKAVMKGSEAYPFTHAAKEQPSLAKAWAYFEHVALARYVVPGTKEEEEERRRSKRQHKNILVRCFRRCFCKGNQQLNRAEPGEASLRTRLYSPIFTPHKQLGDWGIGIGLYFATLRAIAILTFLAGVLNTLNFMYFSSPDYDIYQQVSVSSPLLVGSAICTDTSWVPCPDCQDYASDQENFASQRIGTGTNVDTNETVHFALRNNCQGATIEQGFVNYATLLFLIVGTLILDLYLRSSAVAFDEDEQTAQDYSCVISNPPGDATDPEEWRQFFYNQFDGAHVTACTVGVDNDLLVKSLVERRELMRQLEMNLEPGTSLDTLSVANIAAQQLHKRRFFGSLLARIIPGIPEIFSRIVVLTAKVQGLAQQSYPASNVFVTFETEAAQRRVLSALSVGSVHVRRNNKNALKNPNHLFRGQYVLDAKEPDEPNTVRWQDLNEKFKDRFKQQLFTILCTFAAIVVIAIVVDICAQSSVAVAAIAISLFNAIFPVFAKLLTACEAHSSEGGKQRSLYLKIAVFRWVNTAVVITIIKPFTLTLADQDGLIPQIYALFFAEIVTTNLIQLADPVGHLQRHFLAPRASTQDAMNLNMQGQEFELAERYTNCTKILFLAVWYCAIFPGALFMCSVALFINYFTDRFSLMRTWKRPPTLGPSISEFSRRYFFPLALVAMAIVSSYYWSGWPFDNLCPADENNSTNMALKGTWMVQPDLGDGFNLTLTPNDQIFSFCRQDFFRYETNSFPFVSANQKPGEEWMTPSQITVTTVFGWTSIAVLALILLKFVYQLSESFMAMFRSTYSAQGDDQGVNFSNVPTISSYIPQVHSKVFSYPLLACNIDRIDADLLDWTDPDRPFAFYDLTKDAEVLLRGTSVGSKQVFSHVAHWPPPE